MFRSALPLPGCQESKPAQLMLPIPLPPVALPLVLLLSIPLLCVLLFLSMEELSMLTAPGPICLFYAQ